MTASTRFHCGDGNDSGRARICLIRCDEAEACERAPRFAPIPFSRVLVSRRLRARHP